MAEKENLWFSAAKREQHSEAALARHLEPVAKNKKSFAFFTRMLYHKESILEECD